MLIGCLCSTAARTASAQTTSSSIAEEVPVSVPVASESTVRYQRGATGWWIVGQLWSLTVPAIILWTGFSARIQPWVTRPTRAWFFTVAA
jgi:hypothetical protein